jgi:hypothetical protein
MLTRKRWGRFFRAQEKIDLAGRGQELLLGEHRTDVIFG